MNINANKRIAIIGAGPAGLAAIKHCLDEDIECIAFEQTGRIGGLWNYVEDTGVDENGLPIYSSMYEGVITNLPKELMEFEDFHYQEKGKSFIPREDVLEYIHQYAEHLNLTHYVKLYHQVLLVEPIPNTKWNIKVQNLKTQEITIGTYDGVIVCNGHFFDPSYPNIPGMDYFKGKSVHSHDYRTPDKYKDKRILIVGAGASGVDISKLVGKVAKQVYLSFDEGKLFLGGFPKKAVAKPRVACFKDSFAIFKDETQEEIDEVIYCTGYKYTFTFLSDKCQIDVDDNWVKPLYKHLINIEHPSMALINIISWTCPFPIFGLAIRFYLALLKGHVHISKEEMFEDLKRDRDHRDQDNLPKKRAHTLGSLQPAYCEDLARTANIKRIPRVLGKMYLYMIDNRLQSGYFKILNEEEFEYYPEAQ